MTDWIKCPKCGALMIGLTGGHICPVCGYRVPVQTVTTTTGTSAEYVLVIRCKDCVHCIPQGEDGDWFYCDVWWKQVRTDLTDYCSRAERKDNDTVGRI